MSYILTRTPHQKINNKGISSQWEGKHVHFVDEKHDRLEICGPKSPKNPNEDRLFVRKVHITQNRCASKNELLYALDEYLRNYKPYPESEYNLDMIIIDHTIDRDIWLKRCLARDESLNNKKIILLMKEIKKNRSKDRVWYKVVIEDLNYDENYGSNRNGRYILRSVTKGPIKDDYKPLKNSYDKDYRVDHSTISGIYKFWLELNKILQN